MLHLQEIINILFTTEEFGRQTIAIDAEKREKAAAAETENQPELRTTLTIPNVKKSTLEQRIRLGSTIAEAEDFTDGSIATALGVNRSQITRWREKETWWQSAKIRLIALKNFGKTKCLDSILKLAEDYKEDAWDIFQWGGSSHRDSDILVLKNSTALWIDILTRGSVDLDAEIVQRIQAVLDQKLEIEDASWVDQWKRAPQMETHTDEEIRAVLAEKPHVDWQYALNALQDYLNKHPETKLGEQPLSEGSQTQEEAKWNLKNSMGAF